jgi:CheY-like chemotaxis protein
MMGGLGLAIAALLARSMNAHIGMLDDRGSGRPETVFFLEIPDVQPPLGAEASTRDVRPAVSELHRRRALLAGAAATPPPPLETDWPAHARLGPDAAIAAMGHTAAHASRAANIVLPAEEVEERSTALAPPAPSRLSRTVAPRASSRPTRAPAAAPPVAPTPAGSGAPLGLHVLVVDDDPMNRRLLCRALLRQGCTVWMCADGDEVAGALSTAQAVQRPFQLVLLDIVMNRVHGDACCAQLRAAGCELPIVAATANARPSDRERYAAVGFDAVLPKPFTQGDLTDVIRAALHARARTQ